MSLRLANQRGRGAEESVRVLQRAGGEGEPPLPPTQRPSNAEGYNRIFQREAGGLRQADEPVQQGESQAQRNFCQASK